MSSLLLAAFHMYDLTCVLMFDGNDSLYTRAFECSWITCNELLIVGDMVHTSQY